MRRCARRWPAEPCGTSLRPSVIRRDFAVRSGASETWGSRSRCATGRAAGRCRGSSLWPPAAPAHRRPRDSSVTVRPAATARAAPRRDAPTRARLAGALRGSIDGDVIRRNNARYAAAEALVRPAFRPTQPAGRRRGHLGARRGGGDPVRAAVRPAPRARVPAVTPTSAHRPSTTAWSSTSAGSTARATTQPSGARPWGPVRGSTASTPRSPATAARIPTGTCPTVGAAGLALGGGLGVDSREHGLTCDRLVSLDDRHGGRRRSARSMRTRTPTCSGPCRGGGGGNFGVVTSLRFATHPTRRLGFFLVVVPVVGREPLLRGGAGASGRCRAARG